MDSELTAASAMLEDALHQFDNIIGSGQTGGNVEFFSNGLQGIAQLLGDLRVTIQAEDLKQLEKEKLLSLLPLETFEFFSGLFSKPQTMRFDSKKQKEFEKLKQENRSLSLQVGVLADQVELQMEKMKEISDLNKETEEKLVLAKHELQKEIQKSEEQEKEIASLQVRIQSQNMVLLNLESAQSPMRTRLLQQDVTTPDEGIVRDEVEGTLKMKLKLLEPKATSTPISSNDHQPIAYQDETPQKPPKTYMKNLKDDQAQTSSLEQVKRPEVDSLQSPPESNKSVSHSENIDKAGIGDVTMHKQQSMVQTSSKSSSSPNLASKPEREISPRKGILLNRQAEVEVEEAPFQNRRKHGIKKFFSSFRLRRSHSSNLSESEVSSQWSGKTIKNSGVKLSTDSSPFQRGGFRATAGPRLVGVSKPKSFVASTKPFAQWTTQEICEWFDSLGLELYTSHCRRWVENGSTLLQATNQDLEKELGIHNPLHKKKLLLSLQAVGDEDEVEGQTIKGLGMDHSSVARWLDDIGLPQYKETFYRARIDCRMLHHLTMGDLQRMKITNLLHTLSLRRAIYTLRSLNFDAMQLRRRPIDIANEKEQAYLWTNHRVMEWLRSIDLAEFAPNLRGSGVHGSLIVFEPQFTGDILASLLHIPSSKSLLRRHLLTKFNEIIPLEYLNLKKKEAPLGGLNIMAKVKIGRRSLGPLARLRNLGNNSYREFSSSEYICPIETKNSHPSLGSHRRKLEMQESKKVTRFETDDNDIIMDSASDDSSIKVVELDESATKKIGVLSAEMATLTNKWSEE